MFNCSACKEVIGPKIKPIRLVVQTKAAEYHNEFRRQTEWGRDELVKVDSQGYEIVKELIVCAPCAGAKQTIAEGSRTLTLGGSSFQEKLADRFYVKLVAFAVAGVQNRLTDNSKRAKRDVEFAVPGIKQFLDDNKKLVF